MVIMKSDHVQKNKKKKFQGNLQWSSVVPFPTSCDTNFLKLFPEEVVLTTSMFPQVRQGSDWAVAVILFWIPDKHQLPIPTPVCVRFRMALSIVWRIGSPSSNLLANAAPLDIIVSK